MTDVARRRKADVAGRLHRNLFSHLCDGYSNFFAEVTEQNGMGVWQGAMNPAGDG